MAISYSANVWATPQPNALSNQLQSFLFDLYLFSLWKLSEFRFLQNWQKITSGTEGATQARKPWAQMKNLPADNKIKALMRQVNKINKTKYNGLQSLIQTNEIHKIKIRSEIYKISEQKAIV